MSEKWANQVVRELNLEGNKVEPKRYVDIDITSSFAHLNPNLRIDEVFGYRRASVLESLCNGRVNILLMDYDGIVPSREKPPADLFETMFRNKTEFNAPRILTSEDIPVFLQPFCQEMILKEIDRGWIKIIKGSGIEKNKRILFAERFMPLIESIKRTALNSSTATGFLQDLRKEFLNMVNIESYGTPESASISLFAQKLEEDLEAGFPFWKMQLPENLKAKHKSNEGTYLFYGINERKEPVKVNFYESPPRFEFDRSLGERVTVPAEESFKALIRRELIPTVSLLNYIVLSPARKSKNTERKVRLHIAGNYMAGNNGYALECLPYFNAIPGFDIVKLICTGYDGRCTVQDKQKTWLSFTTIFPHFGKKGLEKYLEQESPFSLDKGAVLSDEL